MLLDYTDERISYCPDTGLMYWKYTTSPKIKVGSLLHSIDGKGYRSVRINNKHYRQHILAWVITYRKFPEGVIDHISGDKLDNSISNLQDVDPLVNSRNTKRRADNSTGIMGVSMNKMLGKYETYIELEGKRKRLGYYEDFFEACCARKSAEHRYGFSKNHGREE